MFCSPEVLLQTNALQNYELKGGLEILLQADNIHPAAIQFAAFCHSASACWAAYHRILLPFSPQNWAFLKRCLISGLRFWTTSQISI